MCKRKLGVWCTPVIQALGKKVGDEFEASLGWECGSAPMQEMSLILYLFTHSDIFETESCCVARACLEFALIPLPRPPLEYRYYRRAPPTLGLLESLDAYTYNSDEKKLQENVQVKS